MPRKAPQHHAGDPASNRPGALRSGAILLVCIAPFDQERDRGTDARGCPDPLPCDGSTPERS